MSRITHAETIETAEIEIIGSKPHPFRRRLLIPEQSGTYEVRANFVDLEPEGYIGVEFKLATSPFTVSLDFGEYDPIRNVPRRKSKKPVRRTVWNVHLSQYNGGGAQELGKGLWVYVDLGHGLDPNGGVGIPDRQLNNHMSYLRRRIMIQ